MVGRGSGVAVSVGGKRWVKGVQTARAAKVGRLEGGHYRGEVARR